MNACPNIGYQEKFSHDGVGELQWERVPGDLYNPAIQLSYESLPVGI